MPYSLTTTAFMLCAAGNIPTTELSGGRGDSAPSTKRTDCGSDWPEIVLKSFGYFGLSLLSNSRMVTLIFLSLYILPCYDSYPQKKTNIHVSLALCSLIHKQIVKKQVESHVITATANL